MGDMPSSPSELLSAAYNDADRTIDLRRRLHRHPEIGLHLPATQQIVLDAFADLPVEVTTGTTTSSVVGVLRGGRPGPTYLLRGDMDALPVHEDTGLPFASEVPGAMHACGHDTHVAMLLGAARLLAERRDLLSGQVVFMVQPGEEGFHGARFMLEEGLLDVVPEAPVSGAFALHISSTMPSGTVNVRPGPMMAAADQWRMVVRGRGGRRGLRGLLGGRGLGRRLLGRRLGAGFRGGLRARRDLDARHWRPDERRLRCSSRDRLRAVVGRAGRPLRGCRLGLAIGVAGLVDEDAAPEGVLREHVVAGHDDVRAGHHQDDRRETGDRERIAWESSAS